MADLQPGKMIPNLILNWINGAESTARPARTFEKFNPATGKILCHAARSDVDDVREAVAAAKAAQAAWAETPAVRRGEILFEIVLAIKKRTDEIAKIVALETG